MERDGGGNASQVGKAEEGHAKSHETTNLVLAAHTRVSFARDVGRGEARLGVGAAVLVWCAEVTTESKTTEHGSGHACVPDSHENIMMSINAMC